MGISIYYIMPLALVSFNLGLLIDVFFLILLAIFQGLILMASNL
jgi:hypothetical protein